MNLDLSDADAELDDLRAQVKDARRRSRDGRPYDKDVLHALEAPKQHQQPPFFNPKEPSKCMK